MPNDFDETTPGGQAVRGSGAPRPSPGDLSNFGKLSNTQTMTFGPSSIFSTKGKIADKRESISRSSSSSNMFSMLSQTADSMNDSEHKLPQRRKLVLQPRSIPKEAASPATPAAAEVESDKTIPDGWAVAGSHAPRPPRTARDFDSVTFGSIRGSPMAFGPSFVFASKRRVAHRRESISRSSSSSNMFSMLSQTADSRNDSEHKLPQRRKLVLQPRSVPKEAASPAAPAAAEVESGDEEEGETAVPEISEKDAKKKIDEDIKELFAVRNLDAAEVYFTGLPPTFHHKLVDKIFSKAIESRAADAELAASFFERASSKGLCGESAFEEGFDPVAEVIDDIALDAPLALKLFAKMVKGAGLGKAARQRLASKSVYNSDELLTLLS